MSENYFYSSLSAQEIEDTLVGAVVFNSDMGLTTSQKAKARANIGAGENDTKVIIMGFFDTLADLQSQIPVGTAGDVYAVGTQSPYDIYIWDATHTEWKDNGPLSFSDAIIDDGDISLSSTWSSSKINTQLGTKQAAITATGMLKGTGSAVQAATLGTDYTAVDDTESASTTKTWSITKILQAIAGFVSFATAQTLTDAQKAQARANIGAAGGWKLLWTNPNPSSAFAAQTVSLDLSAFSEIKVHYLLNDTQYSQGKIGYFCFGDKSGSKFKQDTLSGEAAGGAPQWSVRSFSADNAGVTFTDAKKKATNVTTANAVDNGQILPYEIYAR